MQQSNCGAKMTKSLSTPPRFAPVRQALLIVAFGESAFCGVEKIGNPSGSRSTGLTGTHSTSAGWTGRVNPISTSDKVQRAGGNSRFSNVVHDDDQRQE